MLPDNSASRLNNSRQEGGSMIKESKIKAAPPESILGSSAKLDTSKCDLSESCPAYGPGCTKSQSYGCVKYNPSQCTT
jgi:hypothetical protein